MHSRHLAFLKQGLLLADQGLSVVIRDILDTCVRFAATIERWGGDLFPRQDETDPRREEKEEEVIAERFKVINDIKAASRPFSHVRFGLTVRSCMISSQTSSEP